jgi:hypothetical protein
VSAANGVLKNDIKPEGVTLSSKIITILLKVTLNFDGSIQVRDLPSVPSTFVGEAYFDYKACDVATSICSEPATVTIAVKTVPTANPDTYKMGLSTSMTVPAVSGVLANDGPVGVVLTATEPTSPTGGTLTLNPNGSFTYDQTAGWTGSDSFTYKACDGTICSTPATVTIEESDACLTVDPTSLEQTLLPDTTGALDLTLINECAVPVSFTLVESGDVVNSPILEEGFENETNPTFPPDFPPDGWVVREKRVDRSWELVERIPDPLFELVDQGQFAAWVQHSNEGIESNEWLISPVLDTTGQANLVLSFRANAKIQYKAATLKVWVLDDEFNPSTGEPVLLTEYPLWDMLRDVDHESWNSLIFRTVHVDLGQFSNYGNIRIAWQYVSEDLSTRGDSFGIDTIKVGGRSGISWLSQSPTSETVAGGGKQAITVTFNSDSLNFGRFEGILFVRNAPYPVINVPVTLIVRAEGNFEYFLPLITK